jgi:hypothetical protein
MSKHRADETSLSLTPLAERLNELADRAEADAGADPRFAAVHDHIAQVADVVREAVAVISAQEQRAGARYDALLGRLEEQSLVAGETVTATRAARDALDDSAEVLADVRALRSELHGSTGLLTGAQAVLEAGVRRMQTSGEALVRYLDDRDVALEAERDRVLRDVLEDFASSLHARERRTLARRLIDVVDRRRDARDAARWRRQHAAESGRPQPEGLREVTAERRVIDLDAAAKLRRASQRG